jgi:transcriptional regulator with XRE-family HTH domain
MGASVAVREMIRVPLENSAFCLARFSADATPEFGQTDRAQQVKRVLKRAGLTMTQLAALTRMSYGRQSPHFIPPTFLHKLRKAITPHICQIVALSELTDSRFVDWMEIFGFDLKLILALQLKIHTERTVLVTPGHTVTAWGASLVRWNSSLRKADRRYLFAKIGRRDAVVYPRLLPGSIVRADRDCPYVFDNGTAADALWLVEHSGGLTCCNVKSVGNEHVVLLPHRPPLSAWPLRLSREARILGLVDLELRPRQIVEFEPMCRPTRSDPPPVTSRRSKMTLSNLLRISRSRTGLTLRAAHGMTKLIARLVGDRDYGIALSLLSDYEAMNRLPRHVAKIMSLCIIYGIDPWELMEVSGIHIDDAHKTPLVQQERRMALRQSA